MSLFDYHQSKEISNKSDWGFASLIMAAFRKADTRNYDLLRQSFPDIYNEFRLRYNSAGGRLEGEWEKYPLGSIKGESKL
jgi:hypothetical protein